MNTKFYSSISRKAETQNGYEIYVCEDEEDGLDHVVVFKMPTDVPLLHLRYSKKHSGVSVREVVDSIVDMCERDNFKLFLALWNNSNVPVERWAMER